MTQVTSPPATAPKHDSGTLFAALNAAMAGKPEAQMRVLAHVRTTSGHGSLLEYINNGAEEPTKVGSGLLK